MSNDLDSDAREEYEDGFFNRLGDYQAELEEAVYSLAEKHGLEVIYYKDQDREPPSPGGIKERM